MTHSTTLTALVCAAILLGGCFEAHQRPGAPVGPTPVSDASIGRPDAAAVDAGAPVVPPMLGRCDPMPILAQTCDEECPADGPPFYAWNGYQCVLFGVCDLLAFEVFPISYSTLGECESATEDCDANICLRTGGRWLPELSYCGHHGCGGRPEKADCDTVTSACTCGVGRYFVRGEGCVLAPELCDEAPPRELCSQSGGTWDGVTCECALGRVFVHTMGCVPDWTIDCDLGPSGTCVLHPIGEGERCDRDAPVCGDGRTCCAIGRGSGPICARPCDCGLE